MILEFYTKQKVIRAMAQNVGLRVVLTKEDAPRTDGTTIYVPSPSPDWTPEEFLLWEYKCYHEMGHCDPIMKDCFDIIKEKSLDMSSFFGNAMNLLDDHRQEYHNHDLYEGKRKIMAKGRGLFLDGQVPESTEEEEDDFKMAVFKALFAWDSYKRVDFQKECLGPAMAFLDTLGPKSLEIYNKLYDSGDRFVTRNMTASEEYDTVEELFKYLDIDPEEAKQPDDPEKGGDEDEAGDRTKYLYHSHGDDEGEKSEYVPVKYEGKPFSEFTPTEPMLGDFEAGTRCSQTASRLSGGGAVSGLANTVRKLVQVRSQAHYQQGLKKGKLGKNLHRSLIPDSGAYGERVFKKKVDNNTKDTCITILLDASGSMYVTKWLLACEAVMMLNDAIGTVGIEYSVIAFTYQHRQPVHFMVKDFRERPSKSVLIDRLCVVGDELCDNSDGESILWAYNRIANKPQKRKMIITLSDGMPSASGQPDAGGFTKRVISDITKAGRVEMYGIGIEDDSVKHLYPNSTVLKSANGLESCLLNVIKNRILR
jgi:Mg-chelatase subunit ChlD